jgi:hypothetical protein
MEPNNPNTLYPSGGKPEMSRMESTFHESVAGQRASAEAKKQGCDPRALDAVATATMGPVMIGNITLYPASEGTFITLRKLATMFARHADAIGLPISDDNDNPGERELYELGLATLVFMDSKRVFRELTAGRLPQLIEQGFDLIFEQSLENQIVLKIHIEEQMNEIRRLSGEEATTPGKPKAAMVPGH